MNLEERTIQMEVTGKREGIKGLIFKKPESLVTLKVVDKDVVSQPTTEREVSFHQYNVMNVGDIFSINMYTLNGRNWYFRKEEAELFKN